jgi:hypothetical protein
MFRKDQLCPGIESCPEVLPTDPEIAAVALPCGGCPRELLRIFLDSERGQWIQSAVEMDWQIRCGLTVSTRDMTYLDYVLLRAVVEERAEYEKEMRERELKKQEHERGRR